MCLIVSSKEYEGRDRDSGRDSWDRESGRDRDSGRDRENGDMMIRGW